MVLIYVITKDSAEARDIGRHLLEERLANSTNVIRSIETLRWNEGEIINTSETILLIKTKAVLYSRIEKRIGELMESHDANIFSMPITQINANFRDKLIDGVLS
ncbi:MAG: divalent cation tolerance protein CutA [Bacteroidota bacterium]